MTRIISITLSKGGVGKTTTTVNLAAGLAAAGRRVLLIDTDTQNQSAKALGVTPNAGLYDLYNGEKLSSVLSEARENLFLIAGGSTISLLNLRFGEAEYGQERQLSKLLTPLNDHFHYILIDNAPGWDLMAINTMFYARELLCPVPLEGLATDGLMMFLQRNEALRSESGVILRYIVPTMVDGRLAQTTELLTALRRRYGDVLCDPIRRSVRVSESAAHGETIFEYDPSGRGAEDYTKLVDRVIDDE